KQPPSVLEGELGQQLRERERQRVGAVAVEALAADDAVDLRSSAQQTAKVGAGELTLVRLERTLDLAQPLVGQLERERRQQLLRPEAPEPDRRRTAGGGDRRQGRSRHFAVKRVRIVRAGRDDQVRLQLLQHTRRLHVVDAQVEARAPAGLGQLAHTPFVLFRSAERAGDVYHPP